MDMPGSYSEYARVRGKAELQRLNAACEAWVWNPTPGINHPKARLPDMSSRAFGNLALMCRPPIGG